MLSAERQPEELRLTCGKMTVEPNMANVIPGRIQFSVDIRHPEEDVLATFHQKLVSIVENISRDKGVRPVIDEYMRIEPVQMDQTLTRTAAEAAKSRGGPGENRKRSGT